MAKLYPYLGVVAVIVAYALIATSILVSPWFNWYNNALSDLGNTSNPANISSDAAWFFDSGLFLSGTLNTLFSILLSKDEHFSWKYVIWTVPLTIASIDLALIGAFNESFGDIHQIVSVIFFFLTAVTLLLYSYVSFPLHTPKMGAIALALGILCAVVWIARWPWHSVAIQETVTSLAFAIFVTMVAREKIRNPRSLKSLPN